MIKPEVRFRAFCGSYFALNTLITLEKYSKEKWQLGKYDFYMGMYNKNSIYNTTYYAEFKKRSML